MKIGICDGDGLEREKYLGIFYSLAKKNNAEASFVLYSKCEEMLFRLEDRDFVDILFLEVQMPDMNGIEAAEKLRDSGYKGEIIFLSSLQEKQYFLSGYDVSALNFIIKDETPMEKIEQIFLKAKAAAELVDEQYILFTAANEWINIPIKSIRYFEIYRRIATVYYGQDKFEFHLYNFQSMETQLAGTGFVRTHRSYLVALKEIKTFSFYSLTMRDGTNLPVGRTYYQKIKDALKNFEQVHAVI